MPSSQPRIGLLTILAAMVGASSVWAFAEPTRTDRYGDPLPPHALARIGTARFHTALFAHSLCFSPDGKSLFWGGGSIGVLDVKTGKALAGPQRLFGGTIALSPDGRLLAIRRFSGQLYLWDTRGKRLRVLGERVLGPIMRDIFGDGFVAFSPDGKLLADGGWGGSIRLWDVAKRKEVRRLQGPNDMLQTAAFSPDGKFLAAAGEDKTIHLWDITSGRELPSLVGHQGSVHAVAFSSDGKTIISVSSDKTLRLWAMRTGKEQRRFRGPRDSVHAVAFSPDGKTLASGGADKTICLWETATGKELCCLDVDKHYGTSAIAFSPDGRMLAATVGNRIRLWDAINGQSRSPTDGIPGTVSSLVFSPDGKNLATVTGSGVQLWNPLTGEVRGRFGDPRECTEWARFDEEGQSLLCFGNHALRWWDVAARREKRHWSTEAETFYFTLSPDGKLAAFFKNPLICLREVASGKELRRFQPNREVICLGFSPDGRFLAGSNYKTVQLWDVATGREVRRFAGLAFSLVFSPNGRMLASAAEDSHNVKLVVDKDGIERRVDDVQRGEVRVWEVASAKELWSKKACTRVAFSPDGRLLATAGPDDLTRLWDPLRDEQLLRLQGAQKTVFSLAFSPKGDWLATGGSDTTALVWDVRPARRALMRPRRKVSPDEWPSVWGELTGSAPEAYRAIARLTDEPEKAILLLRDRLQPAVLDNRRVLKLIANLDSDSFADREKAMRELETFGERAVPAILKALGQRPSPEVRRRLEGLCEKLARLPLDRETLRALRAVEALEQIGTTEARRLLEKLAGGTPDAQLTREAQSSLRRLAKLPTDKR